MSSRTVVHSRLSMRGLSTLLTGVLIMTLVSVAWAGLRDFRNTSVGGISIDVEGVVGPPSRDGRIKLLDQLRNEIQRAPAELNTPVPLRMISLRGLEAACQDALRNNFGRLPEEVKFLAGIQRLQYLFVYPEQNDIVLAGPGEGWKIDDRANVVGVTTGRPVLQLDDLLVALRSVQQARQGGITCSIEPTEEGTRALNRVLQQQRTARASPPVLEKAIKDAFGPQQIKISGVPLTSHFARVLSAADYRMKRLAMNIDEAPVEGFPSYLDLIKRSSARVSANVNPRWWLACNYEPLAASEDGLAWELRGPGVKALTEEQFITADGRFEAASRTSPAAQKWADLMTEKYEALSVQDAVFGQLRNLMDMCVVAALIEKEGLWEKSGLSVPLLTGAESNLKLETWNAPKTILPEVSFLRTSNALIVTASGGVQVESWQVASRKEVDQKVDKLRQQAASRAGKSLWWQ